MKVVVGLGNPGPEYDDTRHNVGWWAVDRLAHDWDLGPFRREGAALIAEGGVAGTPILLVKPTTYMNRSGRALASVELPDEFDVSSDLLVVVDDAALEVGRLRLRPEGGAGGHNGLQSIEDALGTGAYARLRIGVGRPPEGADWTDWVLSSMPAEDEERVVELLDDVVAAVELWLADGAEAAMNRFNR